MQEIETAIGEANAQSVAPPFVESFVEHGPIEHDLILGCERGREERLERRGKRARSRSVWEEERMSKN
jgi:hypothetical protein